MKPFKIGVMCDSFRVGPREGVKKAREVGADGIQVHAVQGEVCPEAMSAEARKEFRVFCDSQGQAISALCGDLGGHGFSRAADNPAKIERSKRIVDLAVDLGTSVVTTHIGVVPQDPASLAFQAMRGACRELGDYASSRKITFAIETGPETAVTLKGFLDSVGSPGIGVNMDPANLVMVTGDDPVQAVRTLAKYIVHTHAKDGVKLGPCDPVTVYHAFAERNVEGLDFGKMFDEVPLGRGQVKWDGYLQALQDIGFTGFLTIEREVGANPFEDIRQAVEFLRAKIA